MQNAEREMQNAEREMQNVKYIWHHWISDFLSHLNRDNCERLD